MRISVNGKIKELTLIDPKTGLDYVEDFMGSYDPFGFDDKLDLKSLSADDFSWWEDVLIRYQNADNKLHEYLQQEGLHFSELDLDLNIDLEYQPDAITDAISNHKINNED